MHHRLFDELPCDVATLLCSLLAPPELRTLARVSRAARRSLFREEWLMHVRLIVPPSDAVAGRLVDGIDEIAARTIQNICVADPTHLHMASDKMGASVAHLRVSGIGYMAKSYEPIMRVRALDRFQQLRSLDLSGSAIVGVSDLSGLTQLIELDISFTVVVDISPLESLTKLEVLNLESTRVKNVNAVRRMPELRVLNLSTTNSLRDLTPITALKKLTTLNINDKDLVEVNTLYAIAPTLTTLDAIDVRFHGAEVPHAVRPSVLSSLASLESLRTWPMSWTQSLDPIVHLSQLKSLDLRFPPFSDLDPLQALVNLEDLRIMISAARDTSPLRVLKKLKKLVLAGCNHDPRSLDFLDHLPELRSLSLSGEIHANVVSRLSRLQSLELNYSSASWDGMEAGQSLPKSMWQALTNVKSLSLRVPVGSPADLSGLDCMPQLESLDLRYATPRELPSPSYFRFLRSLVNLRELRLAGGGISDLSDLRDLVKLEYLDLTSTNASDIQPLSSLRSLRNVELGYTRVRDVTPLTKLSDLSRVMLPTEASCCPLVEAGMPKLRVILHDLLNCLWNDAHREAYYQREEDGISSRLAPSATSDELLAAFGDYTGDY